MQRAHQGGAHFACCYEMWANINQDGVEPRYETSHGEEQLEEVRRFHREREQTDGSVRHVDVFPGSNGRTDRQT
jgi:hypothetical protein